MRLARRHVPRPQIATTPMANLAMLVLTTVMIAGMISASRGPALRFASPTTGGGFDDRDAVRVEVDSENRVSVDGEPVDGERLAATVTTHLAGRSDGAVVLAVSPDASYQSMIDAYAAIAALPGPPRIALPSRPRRVNG